MLVSNIFYFHPYLGKIPILTNIFQMGWNHQLVCFWYWWVLGGGSGGDLKWKWKLIVTNCQRTKIPFISFHHVRVLGSYNMSSMRIFHWGSQTKEVPTWWLRFGRVGGFRTGKCLLHYNWIVGQGLSPLPVIVANEGLGWDSLLKI